MMTSFFGAISTAVRWLLRLVGGIIGLIWLVYLFAGAILLAALCLSAIQLRDQLDRDGKGEISFKEVADAQEKYNSSIALIFQKDRRTISKIERELDTIEAKIVTYSNNLGNFFEWGPIAEEYQGIWYQDFPNFISLRLDCERDPINPETGQVFPACEIVSIIAELTNEFHSKQDDLPGLYASSETEFWAEKERIQAAQPLYKYFSNSAFFVETVGSDWLLTLPREVLVLVLTMAMGLLGSVVTMTWSFVRQDSGMTVQRFVVLPIVGMTTAFIVLVFINAGQMTLTAGANGSLNPFALSFIGIISGLLSERAYARLSDVGNNFFATAGAEVRWANHLKEAMEADSVTTHEISRHLGLPEEEVERIVSEALPATLDQQRLIAASMRMPLRDLFTDAPPDAADKKLLSVAPYLIGLDEKEAKRSLLQAGLTLGNVTKRTDGQAAPGAVLLQSPMEGALIARSSKVDVTVSAGPAAATPGNDPATTADNAAGQEE